MKDRRIYFFIGTTAELIKLAPVIKELKNRRIEFKLISSGQNRLHFEDLKTYMGVTMPDIEFKEKLNKSSGLYFFLWAIKTFFSGLLLLREEFKGLNKTNSYFIVHGDTVSALIGSFIAKIYNLKLVHVESGLYSFNFLEPFPEEICRNIIDRLADVLFPPNQWAKNNVKHAHGNKIVTKENTLIESYLWSKSVKPITPTIKNLKKIGKYYVLIMHRQEHVMFRKDWSKRTLQFVVKNSDPHLECLVFSHPLTIELIKSLDYPVKTIPRLPYTDFMKLMENAEFIATDGCTNQLEAYYMGLPCLALRERTEQKEGLGRNVIICKGSSKIMKSFLDNYKKYCSRAVLPKIKPSKIIVDYLMQKF